MVIEHRIDDANGRHYLTLTIPGTSAVVEGEGNTLHEAMFDAAEQVENEVDR